MMNRTKLPIVYSCSGCSSAAQTANMIAVKMDRENVAEMSCIAGVGGDVKPLVKMAKSGREIIAIDGCMLSCCKSSLSSMKLSPSIILCYLTLTYLNLWEKTRTLNYSRMPTLKF